MATLQVQPRYILCWRQLGTLMNKTSDKIAIKISRTDCIFKIMQENNILPLMQSLLWCRYSGKLSLPRSSHFLMQQLICPPVCVRKFEVRCKWRFTHSLTAKDANKHIKNNNGGSENWSRCKQSSWWLKVMSSRISGPNTQHYGGSTECNTDQSISSKKDKL